MREQSRSQGEARCRERVDGDLAFGQAVQGRPVVLGVYLTPTHNGAQASLTAKAGFSFIGDPPSDFVCNFNGILVPIPELADNVTGLGFLNWLRTTTGSSAVCPCF